MRVKAVIGVFALALIAGLLGSTTAAFAAAPARPF
jgi:hypothetical protein